MEKICQYNMSGNKCHEVAYAMEKGGYYFCKKHIDHDKVKEVLVEEVEVKTDIKSNVEWFMSGETHIPNSILLFQMPSNEKMVLLILMAHAFKQADGSRKDAFISLNTLAKEGGMNKMTVCKHIKSLHNRGWIAIEKKNKPNSKEKAVNVYRIITKHLHKDMVGSI